MRITRLIFRLALPAGIVLGGLTMAAAQGSPEARQACTPDAMRLCSEFIPNVEQVKSCMLRKRGQLSEACRMAMRGGTREGGRRAYYRYRHGVVHHHYYRHRVIRHHYYRHYRRRR